MTYLALFLSGLFLGFYIACVLMMSTRGPGE